MSEFGARFMDAINIFTLNFKQDYQYEQIHTIIEQLIEFTISLFAQSDYDGQMNVKFNFVILRKLYSQMKYANN